MNPPRMIAKLCSPCDSHKLEWHHNWQRRCIPVRSRPDRHASMTVTASRVQQRASCSPPIRTRGNKTGGRLAPGGPHLMYSYGYVDHCSRTTAGCLWQLSWLAHRLRSDQSAVYRCAKQHHIVRIEHAQDPPQPSEPAPLFQRAHPKIASPGN
jgi:hypothetical protein